MCLLALGWEHWDWISHKLMRLHGGNEADAQLAAAEADRLENVCEPQPAEDPELDETAAKEEEQITPALHVRLLGAFSPQRTLESLVSLTQPDVEFPLIHLLKILGTLMIYVNLKYIMAGHLPLTNRDAFVGTVNRNWSLAYRIPLLYSDMLLLIGGFLVAHQLSNDMEQTCRLSFLRNVGSKACRHMPSILAVIGFQTWILPHLGSGPLWHLLVGENARLCEENMWRNALSVQNTGDLEEMVLKLISLSLILFQKCTIQFDFSARPSRSNSHWICNCTFWVHSSSGCTSPIQRLVFFSVALFMPSPLRRDFHALSEISWHRRSSTASGGCSIRFTQNSCSNLVFISCTHCKFVKRHDVFLPTYATGKRRHIRLHRAYIRLSGREAESA